MTLAVEKVRIDTEKQEKDKTFVSDGLTIRLERLNQVNQDFLKERLEEKNIDDVISLARIIWNNFPELKLSNDSKALIEAMIKTFRDQVQKMMEPLESSTTQLIDLIRSISDMSQNLPSQLREHITAKIEQIEHQIKNVHDTASNSSAPILEQIGKLSQTMDILTNKPNIKGVFGEKNLTDIWQSEFLKDQITEKGGPGKSDHIIIPYLSDRRGDRISIERKTGSQKYSRNDLEKCVDHAKKDGSKYGIVLYDSKENLITNLPMYIEIIDEILIIVTEIQNGGWKIARYVIETFQSSISNRDLKNVSIDKMKAVVYEMKNISSLIDELRTKNNSAIKSCTSTRDCISKLEDSLTGYIERLRAILKNENDD